MAEGLLSFIQIESAFVPVDMQTADNNGDWVSLENYKRCALVLFKGIGTAADDPVFKAQQADSSSGGNAKDINFTVIHKKVGATALTGVATWSRATQTAATSHTDAASAENEALMVVEFAADELDVDNGFLFLRLDIANIGGNAQLGCGLYLLYEPRYARAGASQIDAKA